MVTFEEFEEYSEDVDQPEDRNEQSGSDSDYETEAEEPEVTATTTRRQQAPPDLVTQQQEEEEQQAPQEEAQVKEEGGELIPVDEYVYDPTDTDVKLGSPKEKEIDMLMHDLEEAQALVTLLQSRLRKALAEERKLAPEFAKQRKEEQKKKKLLKEQEKLAARLQKLAEDSWKETPKKKNPKKKKGPKPMPMQVEGANAIPMQVDGTNRPVWIPQN